MLPRFLGRFGSKYTHVSTRDPNEVISDEIAKTSARPKRYKPAHTDTVSCLCIVRPGILITGSKDKRVIVHNLDSGDICQKWDAHHEEVSKVSYMNHSGNHLALSGSRDTLVKAWDLKEVLQTKDSSFNTYTGHNLTVTGLSPCGRNGNQFVSGSRDCSIRLWDVETAQCLRKQMINRNLVTHITWNSTTGLLAQSSEDKEVKIWDAQSLSSLYTFPRRNHIQTYCEFSHDGNLLFSSSNGFNGDGCEISVWDVRQRRLLREMRGHGNTVSSLAFLGTHGPRKLLLSASLDRSLRIWNVEDGGCLLMEDIPYTTDNLICAAFGEEHVVICGGKGLVENFRLEMKAGRPVLQRMSIQQFS